MRNSKSPPPSKIAIKELSDIKKEIAQMIKENKETIEKLNKVHALEINERDS